MAAGTSKLTKAYQTPSAMLPMLKSQTARDKMGSREGNSPDLQLDVYKRQNLLIVKIVIFFHRHSFTVTNKL